MLKSMWYVFCARISHSAKLWISSFCTEFSIESFELLSLSICFNISENAIDFDSALLAYLAMYFKAAWIFNISFRSIFAHYSCNCNLLCGLIIGSFLAVISSGCPLSSSRIYVKYAMENERIKLKHKLIDDKFNIYYNPKYEKDMVINQKGNEITVGSNLKLSDREIFRDSDYAHILL